VIAAVTSFGVTFVLDLLPGQPGMARSKGELRPNQGETGWGRIDGKR